MRPGPTGPITLWRVPTLVFDPQPTELEQLLERRHRLDQDRRDEVWEGVLHMIPPPSHEHERIAMTLARLLGPLADAAGLELTGTVGIGVKDDYRVPDLAVHRPGAEPQWHPTAALVVEIVSPGDKSWEKLGFYAAHQVDELLIVDPTKRKVDWLALGHEAYGPADGSALIDLAAEDVARRLGWSSPPGR
jgi:Uma2 family endonuclease